MEDLRSALMEDSEKYVEFDEFLESLDAPRYFDFTAVDNSRPDGPSWFCDRIGCNQDHEHVDTEALDRSFKLRVRAARRTPTQQQKPPKPDGARPTSKYAHSAPAKPAASARVGGAAPRALIFYTPKKMTRETCAQKADCHLLTSNKGEKSDSRNSTDLVPSEMPNSINSICSTSETSSIISEIPASGQTTQTESVESAMDANKENVPNTTCLEENCDKSNLLQKASNVCGAHHGEREKSKRTTKPKPFKLLTNERRIQREANLEKNLNSEAKRETVSALRCRDGMKNNQIGKRVQKPQHIEAKVARGKMVKLAEKTQCHKPEGAKQELGEKSKLSVRTPSLMAPRNTHSSLANRNKVIKANTCLQAKKLLTAQQATGPAFVCRDVVTENQIDKRVQKKPHPSGARVAHDKSVRLARAQLITSNPQCQKENQIDKRAQKPPASEARLAHDKSVRLARAKLITSNPQCQQTLQSESSKDKLCETSHKEVVVKVASLKQPRKAQSLVALRNAHSSSSHGNKVITANAHSQVKKSATVQGVTGLARDEHNQIDNRMQKPQRIKGGLDLSNMAGDILMTENSHCRKVASSSTRQHFKTPSLIEARNASSSSTQGTTFMAGKAIFSRWKKSATAQRLTASAIGQDGSNKNEIGKTVQKSQPIEPKLANRKMVRFVGDNSIANNPQCQKTNNKNKLREKSHKEVVNVGSSSRLNSPSPIAAQNAQSCAPHGDEVVTEGVCSPERRQATTTKDPNMHKIHVREGCLKKPEMTIS